MTDINDILQVTGKLTALKGLDARLREIRAYLDLVIDEKLPLNHEILYHLQVPFSLPFSCNIYSCHCIISIYRMCGLQYVYDDVLSALFV